jgi:general secretion pathway protein G
MKFHTAENSAVESNPAASPPGTRRRAGFTIAEMMVVIVIIGLIAAMIVPNLGAFFGQAQSTKVKADIKSIVDAIESHRMVNAGKYPESLEEVVNPPGGGQGFLKSMPKDPWGNTYQFEPKNGSSPMRVYTLGADNSPGGEGEDADVDNITLFEGTDE